MKKKLILKKKIEKTSFDMIHLLSNEVFSIGTKLINEFGKKVSEFNIKEILSKEYNLITQRSSSYVTLTVIFTIKKNEES